MIRQITSYRTVWNATINRGSFRFKFDNNTWTNWTPHDSIQEYQVILMLLQNESPVFLQQSNVNVKTVTSFFTNVEDTGI